MKDFGIILNMFSYPQELAETIFSSYLKTHNSQTFHKYARRAYGIIIQHSIKDVSDIESKFIRTTNEQQYGVMAGFYLGIFIQLFSHQRDNTSFFTFLIDHKDFFPFAKWALLRQFMLAFIENAKQPKARKISQSEQQKVDALLELYK